MIQLAPAQEPRPRPAGHARRVSEVMRWAVQTVDVDDPSQAALEVLVGRQINHLPVLSRGVLAGMLCACDLRGAAPDSRVGLHMRTPALTIPVFSWTDEASTLLRAWDVGCLPVLYHGFLVGIVTAGDLARANGAQLIDRPACWRCGGHHHVRVPDRGRPVCIDCAQAGAQGATP